MEVFWILFLFFLIFLILFFSSSSFNYMMKFAYLTTVYMSMAFIIILISLPRPKHPTNGLIAAHIFSVFHKTLGVEWILEGEENLKPEGGAVIVLNHQSGIDVMPVMEIWKKLGKLSLVAKKSLLYAGPFGIACWFLGIFFIERKSKTSHADVNNAGQLAKKTKTKLLVFPEGTRNGDKNLSMRPFKKGAFHVALDAEMPIIPVVVSEYNFLDWKKMFFRPGRAIIRVLPPIQTSDYTKANIEELIEKTRTQMLETLVEISETEKSK